MRDPIRPETSFQGRQFPRDGTGCTNGEEQVDLGDLCLSVGNLSDALAYYRTALERVPGDDAGAKRDVILRVVDCLRRQSKHEDALGFLADVIAGFRGVERRDLLAEKATLLCLLGRYGEAAEVCQVVRAGERGGSRGGDARIYLVLGHVLLRVCKWKQAVRCFEEAATFARMSRDLTCLGNALNNLGIAYKNLCRFEVSLKYLGKAVAVARRENNDASLAVRLLNLANAAYKAGRLEKAAEAVREAMAITDSLNLGRLRVLCLITSARIEMLDGGIVRARRLVEEAVERARSLEDPRACAIAYETLGEAMTLAGDYPGAAEVLGRCLKEAPPECKDVGAEAGSRLADLCLARGDSRGARRRACAAMKVAAAIGDRFEVARCRRTLSLALDDRARRIAGLKNAERLFRRIGALAEASVTAHRLGALAAASGRSGFKETLGHLERALEGFEKCGLRARATRVLCDLAQAYTEAGRYEAALGRVERAGRLAQGGSEEALVKDVRSRIDEALSRSLAQPPAFMPASVEEVRDMLASAVGISGLVVAGVDSGGSVSVAEALGLERGPALALASRAAAALPSTTFLSDVAASWRDLEVRDVRALLAMPADGCGARGLILMTWNRPLDGACGPAGPFILKATYECRRVMPVLASSLTRDEAGCLPVCLCGIVSADPGMKQMLFSLPGISATSANVLITGETGTGKDLVARAVHMLSSRAGAPFVAQNCAALPEHLLESELFGHRSGAFTGARGDKRGLLEAADGGVFFLDEVGDISPVIQAKMLRAVEAGEIRRLGDTVSRRIDVRFVSATNRNLDEEVAGGRMRKDLYYRLNVVHVSLPPLREREADIRLLARLFLGRFAERAGKRIERIEGDALEAFAGYDWPGNVRQLENEIERAVAFTQSGEPVTRRVLSACIGGRGESAPASSLKAEVRTVEKRRILAALRQHGWNKTHAARSLGDISRPALIAKMKRLGIPLRREDG
jgi:transcriptional regulator with AAA-type ATPase domain/tetratricopeptide (TPR) repeat protein